MVRDALSRSAHIVRQWKGVGGTRVTFTAYAYAPVPVVAVPIHPFNKKADVAKVPS